ncbi:ABC transporter ATP-binding protein [Desulfohalovibrio reitneri]|uniref:ABC transporter ATP-binding protein n=1 Tax=Desulfohalovibrio reitneri TaxID=1307759 RepID=UPI0005573DC3|nr:ABC transporter ATP-binding protein [Desulfohalovibrio reitneri]
MSENVIEVTGLSKRFGDVRAVDDVTFGVGRGRIVGLLGPNGAGKTTTIHMLLGLLTPTGGQVRVLGMELAANRREVLSRVNFSSAYVNMPENLKVWENMRVFAMLYGVDRPKERAAEVLEWLGIAELANRLTGSLSSGQTTRLNLAKALLNKPEILFLDEPTASLDPDMADRMRSLVRDIREESGTTMLFTSHNMREVEEVCDEVVFLARGRVLDQGPVAEVVARAQSEDLEHMFIRVARDGALTPGGKG